MLSICQVYYTQIFADEKGHSCLKGWTFLSYSEETEMQMEARVCGSQRIFLGSGNHIKFLEN